MTAVATPLSRTKVSLSLTFAYSGLLFSTLASRMPDLRAMLHLSNTGFGLLVLAGAVGSMAAMPVTGIVVARFGPAAVVRQGVVILGIGLTLVAFGLGVLQSVPVVVAGLLIFGAGFSLWDVAMSVEATAVERALGRTMLSRFHAAWSIGTISGGLVGVVASALDVPVLVHVVVLVIPVLVAATAATRTYLPAEHHEAEAADDPTPGRSAWLEPRTIVIGLLALVFGLAEGVADDWISLGVIDGYHTPHWVGVTGYFIFVTMMLVGRLIGPAAIDRFGRPRLIVGCAAAISIGVVVLVFGSWIGVAYVGIVLWGLGTSMGFSVAIGAAGDDAARSAARVAVVSTIAYTAFLAGPPVIGWLADQTTTLHALLIVAVLMVPGALTSFAAKPPVGSR